MTANFSLKQQKIAQSDYSGKHKWLLNQELQELGFQKTEKDNSRKRDLT